MTKTTGGARRTRRGHRITTAAIASLALAGAAAAPAGALTPPMTYTLELSPVSGSPIELWRYPVCDDVSLPQPPSARPVATISGGCPPPVERAPRVTIATPATFDLRSNWSPAALSVGYESAAAGLAAPVVTQRDGRTWTLALPELPTGTTLRVDTGVPPTTESYYLTLDRPAGPPPKVEQPVDPIVDDPAGEVAIVKASRRGRVATVVVDATPGAVSAYLTTNFRRRTAVARATVKRAGMVRLRVPLGRLSARALASAGVTVVLRPADGGRQVRAGVRWKAAVASR